MLCLQEDYMSYNLLLGKIQKHIQLLFKNNIISINDRNLRLSNIYEIIRKINILKEKLIMLCDNYDNYDISDIDTDNYNCNNNEYYEKLYNALTNILQRSLNKNILLTNSNLDNYIFLRINNIVRKNSSKFRLIKCHFFLTFFFWRDYVFFFFFEKYKSSFLYSQRFFYYFPMCFKFEF